jgi:hypothetical protein
MDALIPKSRLIADPTLRTTEGRINVTRHWRIKILERLTRPLSGNRRKPRRDRRSRRSAVEQLEGRVALSAMGTWTPLTHLMPDSGSGTGNMMLLSNGTVMIQGGGASDADFVKWYKLTPDSKGNYVDGTWSQLASMSLGRLDYTSVVLPDGEVMVLGGEYSGPNLAKTFTAKTTIYNPVSNTWRIAAPVPDSSYGDEPSEVLQDGTVLTPDGNNTSTYIYHPTTNTWSTGPARLFGDTSYEENWVKLPGGQILAVPTAGSRLRIAQVFKPGSTPATDAWVSTAGLPAALAYAPQGEGPEMGPGILLTDGRVWQIGGNNLTAIYTPPSQQHPTGSWTAGPSIPQPLQGKTLTGADVAAAELPNGRVLFTASPFLDSPTYFYVFSPSSVNGGVNTVTPISSPPAADSMQGHLNSPGWHSYFLDLPNGQILYDQRNDSKLWLYTPSGAPSNSWRPTVSSVRPLSRNTFSLTGTLLNGMSEGAYYGDDSEMSSNYPIVTLTAKNGTVYFARTFNWSNTSVQTGKAVVTTQLTIPAGLQKGTYELRAIANGIASTTFNFRIR